MSSSAWYHDAAAVLTHLRLAGAGSGPLPVIPGYDDLVQISRGGQGVVYAATQRSTRRRVAVKLLLDGAYASVLTRRRFEREIDLVAGLKNPNIVQIYDSGLTAEGRPYFVMEYVEGDPLDRYAREAGLAPPPAADTTTAQARTRVERLLRLFLPICEAVQYAHQRGVIHRDLKPANIRVDTGGVPRILDFGLARGLMPAGAGVSGSSAAELTVSGQFMGSLPWASPEHASGSPESIDTRSDVYSLGVVLYFLLTGRFPYAVDGALRDVLDNIQRSVPARPSALVRGLNDDAETIVLKGLAKEPARRYQSEGDLADDIRSFLSGEPIQARRDSAWYTLRRTLRRYQWAAAGAAAVMLAVTAGLIVSITLWRQANRETHRANEQQQLAERERSTAEQESQHAAAVSDFLVSMLAAADPAEEAGRDVRVADLLDDAAADAATQFADQPATRLAVQSAIGRSYLMLGLYTEAADQLTAALQVAEADVDTDDADRLEAMHRMAEVRHRQGKLDESIELLREVLTRRRELWGESDDRTHATLLKLAMVLSDHGAGEESLALAREAVEIGREHLGLEHRQTLAAMNLLGVCLMRAGQLAEAEPILEETLEVRRRVLGEEHTDTITAMSDLAHVLWLRGNKERADELLQHTYESTRAAFGDDHPRTLLGKVNLGHSRRGLKRTEEAITLFSEALADQRRVLGDDHPEIINTSAALATALRAAGRLDEAEPLYRQVAEDAPRVLGPENPNTLIYTSNFGYFLMARDKPAEAEVVFRKVYTSAQSTLGEAHYLTASLRGNLGESLMVQKRYDEAEPHLLASYEGLVAAHGAEHPDTKDAAADLVKLYTDWEKPEGAEKYHKLAGLSEPGA